MPSHADNNNEAIYKKLKGQRSVNPGPSALKSFSQIIPARLTAFNRLVDQAMIEDRMARLEVQRTAAPASAPSPLD